MKKRMWSILAAASVALLALSGAQAANAAPEDDTKNQFQGVTPEEWQKMAEQSEQILGSGTDPATKIKPISDLPPAEEWKYSVTMPDGTSFKVPDKETKEEMEKAFVGIEQSPSVAKAIPNQVGTWYPVSNSWIQPSYWHCGPTYQNREVALALCVVRVNSTVQAASVVQSTVSWNLNNIKSTQYLEQRYTGTLFAMGTCPPAYFVPYGRAACTIPGGTSSAQVKNNGNVYGGSTTALGYATTWY